MSSDSNEPSIDDIVASIRRIISDEEVKTRKPPPPAAAKSEDILELTDMLNDDGSVTPLSASAPKADSLSVMPFDDVEDEVPIYAAARPSADPVPPIINRPPPKPMSPPPAAAAPQPAAASAPVMAPAVARPTPDPASAPQPPSPPGNPTRVTTNMTSTNLGAGSNVTLTPVNSSAATAPSAPAAPASGAATGIVSAQTAGAATSAFDRLAQAALQQNAPPAPPKPATVPGASKSIEDLAREMLRPMLQQWMDANLPGMVERLVQQEIQRLTKR